MPTIKELIDEAEENFSTGRHGNSAPLFKRAGLETLHHGVMPDGMYLLYRAILDYHKIDAKKEQLQLMHSMAKELYSQIQKQCSKELEEGDDMNRQDRVDFLRLQVDAMSHLHKTEETAVVKQTLVSELQEMYEQTGKITHLEEALDHDTSIVLDYLEAILENARNTLETGSFDVELVAFASILQGLQRVPQDYRREIADDIFEFLEELATTDELSSDDISRLIDRYNSEWVIELLKSREQLPHDFPDE